MKQSPLITVAEAMRLLGVTRPTVHAMVTRRELTAARDAATGKWLIVRASVRPRGPAGTPESTP